MLSVRNSPYVITLLHDENGWTKVSVGDECVVIFKDLEPDKTGFYIHPTSNRCVLRHFHWLTYQDIELSVTHYPLWWAIKPMMNNPWRLLHRGGIAEDERKLLSHVGLHLHGSRQRPLLPIPLPTVLCFVVHLYLPRWRPFFGWHE